VIRSSSFGPVRLTGKDVVRFKEALRHPTDPVVFRLAALGRSMAEMDRDDPIPTTRPARRRPKGS